MTTCRTHSCWRSLTVAMSIPTLTPWFPQVGHWAVLHTSQGTVFVTFSQANTTTACFAVLVMVALQRLGPQEAFT